MGLLNRLLDTLYNRLRGNVPVTLNGDELWAVEVSKRGDTWWIVPVGSEAAVQLDPLDNIVIGAF